MLIKTVERQDMRTWSDEYKKMILLGTAIYKCPNCGNRSILNSWKLADEKGNFLSVKVVWNIPDNSYMICQKCNYKIAVFKSAESEIDIIKNDKLKSYSVADELLKWAKLKEDGHISEQEFDDAKKKLLKRD